MSELRPNRRVFLQSTAAALGTAFLPDFLQEVPAQQTEESVDLPMIEVKSTDAALPGTWHILDRSKPIRKLIDRKSLLPVGPRSLVMIDIRMQATFNFASKRSFAVMALPADVGDEQTLLGCHVSVRTEKGKEVESTPKFHQA